jgi:hypothetical protein
LADQEATEEYISTEMSNMGWICAVCQGERKKAIIALESAANLESDQRLLFRHQQTASFS